MFSTLKVMFKVKCCLKLFLVPTVMLATWLKQMYILINNHMYAFAQINLKIANVSVTNTVFSILDSTMSKSRTRYNS